MKKEYSSAKPKLEKKNQVVVLTRQGQSNVSQINFTAVDSGATVYKIKFVRHSLSKGKYKANLTIVNVI